MNAIKYSHSVHRGKSGIIIFLWNPATKNVQMANFGRELNGQKDSLPKYGVGEITITDERVIRESGKSAHPILRYTGNLNDQVIGTVFEVTDNELIQADNYEIDKYKRISAELKSGRTCWIYAAANENS